LSTRWDTSIAFEALEPGGTTRRVHFRFTMRSCLSGLINGQKRKSRACWPERQPGGRVGR
jgi:hypothetical protein